MLMSMKYKHSLNETISQLHQCVSCCWKWTEVALITNAMRFLVMFCCNGNLQYLSNIMYPGRNLEITAVLNLISGRYANRCVNVFSDGYCVLL